MNYNLPNLSLSFIFNNVIVVQICIIR